MHFQLQKFWNVLKTLFSNSKTSKFLGLDLGSQYIEVLNFGQSFLTQFHNLYYICKGDFAGKNCLQEKCPGGCGAGYCNNKTSLCECTEGYTGANCSKRALGQLEGEYLLRFLVKIKCITPKFGHQQKIHNLIQSDLFSRDLTY